MLSSMIVFATGNPAKRHVAPKLENHETGVQTEAWPSWKS